MPHAEQQADEGDDRQGLANHVVSNSCTLIVPLLVELRFHHEIFEEFFKTHLIGSWKLKLDLSTLGAKMASLFFCSDDIGPVNRCLGLAAFLAGHRHVISHMIV